MEREIIIPEKIIAAQEDILTRCGLWATPELKNKYAFRLSPDALTISLPEKQELDQLSMLLYADGGFFDGAVKLQQKTLDNRFTSTPVGSLVLRALTAGIQKRDVVLQGLPSALPVISRVDLIKTQASDGLSSFKIAEVEGDKTHGLGYLTLMDFFRKEFMDRQDTHGIIQSLKENLVAQKIDPNRPIMLIVGQGERFYLTELQVFAQASQEQGLNIFTVLESEVVVSDTGVTAKNKPVTNTILNLPTLTPSGNQASGIDADKLYELVAENKISCLIPPKRFLGSKGLLALVSNGDQNPELESVLHTVFDPDLLKKIRRFIPTTILITKKNKALIANILATEADEWVIKKTVSSGMKGVALPSDSEKAMDFADMAINSPFNFIIQRKVNQAIEVFSFSEPEKISMQKAPMFMRIELFASPIGLVTIGVTAREEPSVHGAKDAIQIPVIIK